ncbi:hypothetical protein K4K58_013266 [Colletotrichum sp. SAR11_239]|nr:hypothetical protein K4K58_013266 [Colletotrichum sp. SAR11_239]
MSLKKFRRKLGWPSSTDDATSQWQRNVQQNQPQPDVLRVGPFNSSTSSSAPTDMAGPPTPETHSLATQASLAHTQDVTIQKPPPTHRDSETPIQELWDLAYQTLQNQDEHLISDFEEAIRGNISAALGVTVGSHVTKRDWMNTILQRRIEQVNRDSWKLKFGSSEVLVRDVAKPILGIITSYCYYARSAAYRAGLDSVKWNEWEELVEKIKDQERVFFAVLTVSRDAKYDEECLAAEKRHKQVMACWQSIGSDISGLLLAVGVAKREKEHEKLFEWLCSVDTSAQYNAARERHSDGTCEWLIQKSEDFKSWRQTPKSFLWLNGKAGSGKSILSSSVIKYFKDQCENDPQTALAYFFF